MMPRRSTDFDPLLTGASQAGLLELARALGPYRSSVVLIGGWVPYLLIQQHLRPGEEFHHVGSIDIDFVVDPDRVERGGYETLAERIRAAGWQRIAGRYFSYEKPIPCPDGNRRDIQVDFLTSAPDEEDAAYLHRRLQPDLLAKTLRTARLAIAHQQAVHLSGRLPDGGATEEDVPMLDVVGCLGTKAIALGERFKHKDAYDIVSVLDNYGAGVSEVAPLVKPFAKEPLLAEALGVIAAKFRSETSDGPSWYADFVGGDDEARSRSRQRGFQLAQELLRRLG